MQAKTKARWVALLLATAMVPASATFHLMKIVELFPGTAASPSAHYVVLQMYASGQNLVAGQQVVVYDAAGQAIETLEFPGDVPNGANQARILLATPQAEDFFGVNADLMMSASLLKAGGKVCFAGNIDCVAWGGYSGSPAGVGTPFNAPGGLQAGRAAGRRLDIAGSSTVLEAGDDTNNSATDFVFRLPAPRNNAGMLGTVPGATCGNGAVEGLEQCDDGNTTGGDGCSASCQVDQVVARVLPVATRAGNYNADQRADVFWRNAQTGGNAIWLSANKANAVSVPAVSDTDWIVAGVGRFDAGGTSDVVWRNTRTGVNVMWRSADRSQALSMPSVTNLAWRIATTGDFDGDGRSDLFWRNGVSGANTIWLSANAQTLRTVASVTDVAWQVVGSGDFNGDGRADVVWRNGATGGNVIWRSASKATPQAMTAVTNLDWEVVAIGDFGGDGKADIFWRNAATGANVVWRGANSTTPQSTPGVSNPDWRIVQSGDFSGDGRVDVFWRNRATGANTIWTSASPAVLQAVAGVADTAWRVAP